MNVHTLLDQAGLHLRQRATTYDQPEGERSMGRTVRAFNAVTGHDLTEADGWLLMALLKMVRDNQRPTPPRDPCEAPTLPCRLRLRGS